MSLCAPLATRLTRAPVAGSDLLTSLTTTFDRKWRSLVNQSSNQAQTPLESASCNRDDAAEQQQQQQKSNASPKFKYPTSMEAYRDPSLHKSLEKSHLSRTKNVNCMFSQVFPFKDVLEVLVQSKVTEILKTLVNLYRSKEKKCV